MDDRVCEPPIIVVAPDGVVETKALLRWVRVARSNISKREAFIAIIYVVIVVVVFLCFVSDMLIVMLLSGCVGRIDNGSVWSTFD
jgi:hypothetical protein